MLDHTRIARSDRKRVVIVGGGFGGLQLAKGLAGSDYQVVLIDKQNYHTFQPLLYQVATAGVQATSIVYPFRSMFKRQRNCFFRLAEVCSVKPDQCVLETSIGLMRYDYLVIATGATTNFYGNKEIESKAISIKSIDDAIQLRNTILTNFEKALQINDEEQLNSLMDFVIVGGGPTGVEIAGALSELKRHVFPNDYNELDFVKMDIHLVQSGSHILKGMSEQASLKALHFLEDLGVKVWLNDRVKSYDGYTVELASGQRLQSRTLIWAAGVTGSPLDGINKESYAGGGRLKVDEYNCVQGYKNIFAIGDVASMSNDNNPEGYPMMAQPAIQQGKQLAQNLRRLQSGKPMEPFHYRDQGSLATIGRNRAVADVILLGKQVRTQGLIAWLIWMFVHLMSIVGFRNRLFVFITWIWNYITYDAGVRVILGSKKENSPVEEATQKAIV